MVGAAKTIMDYICLSVREIWDCFGGERKHGVKRGFTRLRKRREESDVSFGAIQWINQNGWWMNTLNLRRILSSAKKIKDTWLERITLELH
jgi:hypothetical protein